jgi:hypothetical protein
MTSYRALLHPTTALPELQVPPCPPSPWHRWDGVRGGVDHVDGGAIYSADESDRFASGRLQRGLVYRQALSSHRQECQRGCPLALLTYGWHPTPWRARLTSLFKGNDFPQTDVEYSAEWRAIMSATRNMVLGFTHRVTNTVWISRVANRRIIAARSRWRICHPRPRTGTRVHPGHVKSHAMSNFSAHDLAHPGRHASSRLRSMQRRSVWSGPFRTQAEF